MEELQKIKQREMSQFVLKQPSQPVKITNVTGDGTYNNKFKHIFTFSDGVTMTATYDTNECPFKEGDEVIYTVNLSNNYGNLGSVKSAQEKQPYKKSGGSGWKPKTLREMKLEQSVRNPSMALAYAKDYFTATGFDPSIGRPHEVITETADHFLAWLDEKTHQVQELPENPESNA